MHPDEQLRKAVRGFYAYLAAVLLAGGAPIAATRMVESHAPAWRVVGVVFGVGAWIPLILVVATIIRVGDEFQRRIQLVALAFAFAGTLVLVSLLDWLVRAEFIAPPRFMVVWLAIAILWVIALIGAKRYYERPQ